MKPSVLDAAWASDTEHRIFDHVAHWLHESVQARVEAYLEQGASLAAEDVSMLINHAYTVPLGAVNDCLAALHKKCPSLSFGETRTHAVIWRTYLLDVLGTSLSLVPGGASGIKDAVFSFDFLGETNYFTVRPGTPPPGYEAEANGNVVTCALDEMERIRGGRMVQIKELIGALGVDRSSFYAWRSGRPKSKRSAESIRSQLMNPE